MALLSDRAPQQPVSLYPESKNRSIVDSWADIGSASWQYQPAIKFMAYCMRSGESPWWNPFDAAGRMEPESMTNVPFSVVSISTALFGGGSTAFSFVQLGLYFVSVFTLLLTLTQYLGVSFLAGCAGCAAFLLNGFALGNLNSQMGQPYFLGPLALLALFALLERANIPRFVLAAFSQAILLLVTQFPPLVLVEISVCCILTVSFWAKARTWANLANVLGLLGGATAAGLCLVAFLYLPIFEANFSYLDVINKYNARLTPGYSLDSALSLFTPKHFWQSHRAFRSPPGQPVVQFEPWVFHIGVIASLVAAAGVSRSRNSRTTAVSIVSALLIAIDVGQMFGIPPFSLIDRLPFFSFVRNEYWPALAGIPMSVLLALGLDNDGKWGDISFGITAAAIATSFGYLFIRLGIPTQDPERGQVFIFLAIFAFGVIAVLLLLLRVSFARQLQWILAFAVLVEGLYYMNKLHPRHSHRDERLPESIEWVKRQVSPGGNRLLNIGGSGVMPDWGSGIQVPEVGAVEISILPQYKRFFSSQLGSGLFLSFFSPQDNFTFTRGSLSTLGVRFVVVDRAFTTAIERLNTIGLKPVRQDSVRLIYENPSPMPRAFLSTQLAQSDLEPWEVTALAGSGVTTSDPRMISEAKKAGIVDHQPLPANLGSVTIEEYHHTKLRIRTVNPVPAMLVVTDSYHPNWKARVDGAEAYVGCVDVAFRGIALSSGSHIVELTYQPKTMMVGLFISIATLLVSGGMLLFDRARPGKILNLMGLSRTGTEHPAP